MPWVSRPFVEEGHTHIFYSFFFLETLPDTPLSKYSHACLHPLPPSCICGGAGTAYNCARSVQLVSPYVVALALEWKGLKGALCVPMSLALAMSAWVWVFPETAGITLPVWDEAARAVSV